MENGKKVLESVRGFIKRTNEDHVGAYSAQAAYFLILSFIPFVLFLASLVKYTPLTYTIVQDAIISFLPESVQGVILSIVQEIFNRNSAIVPLTVVTALWAAGKGCQAMINGLNTIYHVKETRNWLLTRIRSVFYTLLFVIALVTSLTLLVLGNRIQKYISVYLPFVGRILGQILNTRTFLVFIVLLCVFLFLYKMLPNRKATLKSQMPGALLTAMAWMVFSYFFSLYFTFFPNFSNMYGSLTAIIMIMLWLYVCMNIVLYGAEINAYYEKDFRQAQEMAKEFLEKGKDEKEMELEDVFDRIFEEEQKKKKEKSQKRKES
ncbi:hypothetical protein B5F53_19370 [Blautia sp. An249]|uniref:YihY/virulence factor BrkB family protein n=1 Tax=Blautia sp. An249 TaxID=1965603 RepID=UPI000B390ED2|nr:YihY/virulence factor BrkB family protein [Blautia sp. An249]OUO73006.1 hypothetical protein B5F53_19370 [Blautia sp. An249]